MQIRLCHSNRQKKKKSRPLFPFSRLNVSCNNGARCLKGRTHIWKSWESRAWGEESCRDSEKAPGSSSWLIYGGTCGNGDKDGMSRFVCVRVGKHSPPTSFLRPIPLREVVSKNPNTRLNKNGFRHFCAVLNFSYSCLLPPARRRIL